MKPFSPAAAGADRAACRARHGGGIFDPEDSMLDMSQYLQDNPYGFLPVPLVITEPAVGFGGGLFGLFCTVKAPVKAKTTFRLR